MQNKLVNDTSSFVSAIITLVVIFVLTFISIFGILTLKEYNKEAANRNQIIVYINNLEENDKEELSKKILQIPGISSIRYESKELALKAVIMELGIELPENENPLEDAFFVYLDKNVNLDNLKENLVNIKEISSFDFRTKAIENSINFNQNISSFTSKATIAMVLFSILMIYSIIKFSIISKKKEIDESLRKDVSVQSIKKVFFIESVISITVAFALSIVVYQYIKHETIETIKILVENYKSTVSFMTELWVLLAIFIVAIIIAYIINYIVMNKYFILCVGENNEGE